MLKGLFRVSVALLVAGQVAVSHAQVINAPAAQPGVGVQQAGGPVAVAPTGAVEQTGWGPLMPKLAMPKITMPKITMPKLTMPQMAMPSMDAMTGPFKSGLGKVTSGTKKAWEGTKEMFTFGQNQSTSSTGRNVAGEQKPSFWNRLLAKQPEPRGPQTVGEFMSQPRLNP